MEFKVLREDFLNALSQAQSVVEKKNIMPVLANCLLESDANQLKISVTDLSVALILHIPCQIISQGSLVIQAKSLFDIAREAPDKELHIKELENGSVHISSKQSQFRILSVPAKDFPKLPQSSGDFQNIKSEDIINLLDKVSFAICTDETRQHLNGVLFDQIGEGDLSFVATDGHRLAVINHKSAFPKIKQSRVIVSRKGIGELRKLAASIKNIELAVNDRYVIAKTESQTLFVRLIDGNFPDYNMIFPKSRGISVKIPRQPLMGALKRVSLLSTDKAQGVSLHFTNNQLTVNTSNPMMGEAKEDLDIQYSGEIFQIGFNARYFLDVLNVLEDDDVSIEFNTSTTPSIITSEKEKGFRSVLMPMRM